MLIVTSCGLNHFGKSENTNMNVDIINYGNNFTFEIDLSDFEFKSNSFDEIAVLSKNHGTEMFQKEDQPHLEAMKEMGELMQTPNAMKEWFDNKRKEFEALPENE